VKILDICSDVLFALAYIYILGKRKLNLFLCHFRQANYIKITNCQVKLILTSV